jgi:hypothetical protein
MEATHYNPALKFGSSFFNGGVKDIDFFGQEISLNLMFWIELVGVWRIKKAESPLQDRLRQRGLIKKFYHSMWEKRIEDLQNTQNNRGQ